MGKKKPFIDKSEAAHFQLVHRSQRDPKSADPTASSRVLTPAEVSGNLKKGNSERGSVSTSRAWAAEQDLDGFGLEEDVSEFETKPAEKPGDNFGMPEDGYDYSKHVRSIGDGVFVPRESARSEASFARSGVTGLSRISRASLASKQGEILLRGVADEAFASAEELPVSVGDTVGGQVAGEDENLAAINEMDEDVRAALFSDEVFEEIEEIDDDFVLKATELRETELLAVPAKPPKRGVYAVPEEVDEGEEGELRVDTDGCAYPLGSFKTEYGEDWQWHWSRASRADETAGAAPAAAASRTSAEGAVEETEETRRKRERRAEAFRLFSGGDDDEGEDDEQSVVSEQPSLVSSVSRSGLARDPGRLLDRQFARLMGEYEEEEIGELDQDDLEVRGGVSLEAYDSLMDDFLSEQRQVVGEGWGEKAATAIGNREFDEFRKGWFRGDKAKALDEEEGGEEDDSWMETHPFFAGLREPAKDDQWDAETILSTYTTTENHPKRIGVQQRPRSEQIKLHPVTGLPLGIELPRTQAQTAAIAAVDDDDEDAMSTMTGINLGEARPRGERSEEKRERKQAAKEEKRLAREQKKEVKLAYKAERGNQLRTKMRTQQLPSTNLSSVNP